MLIAAKKDRRRDRQTRGKTINQYMVPAFFRAVNYF